jgi:hypothetical protein
MCLAALLDAQRDSDLVQHFRTPQACSASCSPPIEPLELNEPNAALKEAAARRSAAIVGDIGRKRR